MKMSANGLEKLKEWEGVVLHQYRDQAGLPSIGVGHLLTAAEKKNGVINIKGQHVVYSPTISMQQALDLLAQDVAPAEDAVNKAVTVPLTQNQYDALVSFAFNVGCGGFRSSTALKVLNEGQYDQVPQWLAKWNKAAGKVCEGLVERRANEIKLWNAEA